MDAVQPHGRLTSNEGDADLSIGDLLTISVFAADVDAAGLSGEELEAAQKQIDKHAAQMEKQLSRFTGSWVLRRVRANEPICIQGQAGNSAYYLLKSDDARRLRESVVGSDRTSGFAAWLDNTGDTGGDGEASLASVYVREDARPAAQRMGGIWGWLTKKRQPRIDPVALADRYRSEPASAGKRICTLDEGELIGEISCQYGTPRSATVIADRDCYVLEILRNILELLYKNKTFRADTEAKQAQRALTSHLENLPIFFKVPPEVRSGPEWEAAWSKLRSRTSLVEKKHGDVIYEEGETYDGTLYVVSLGQVRVTKKGAGGDRILGYMRRGDVIGEIGYLASLETPEKVEPSDDDTESPQETANVRTATCTAFFHPTRGQNRKGDEPRRVELVRIEADAFSEFLYAVPQVREVIERLSADRMQQDISKPEETAAVLAGRFAELGLIQGEKLMLIDLVRCTRCDECVRACVKTHHDGRTRLLREGPRFGDYLVPASCRQCNDPVCLSGCPVASIHKGDGGQIIIEDWCIGCTKCAEQCPYDAINMYELPAQGEESKSPGRLAAVCDQCQSLSDGVPSCVYACPHDAALRVDAMSFFGSQAPAATATARQAQ